MNFSDKIKKEFSGENSAGMDNEVRFSTRIENQTDLCREIKLTELFGAGAEVLEKTGRLADTPEELAKLAAISDLMMSFLGAVAEILFGVGIKVETFKIIGGDDDDR